MWCMTLLLSPTLNAGINVIPSVSVIGAFNSMVRRVFFPFKEAKGFSFVQTGNYFKTFHGFPKNTALAQGAKVAISPLLEIPAASERPELPWAGEAVEGGKAAVSWAHSAAVPEASCSGQGLRKDRAPTAHPPRASGCCGWDTGVAAGRARPPGSQWEGQRRCSSQ